MRSGSAVNIQIISETNKISKFTASIDKSS